MKAVAQSHRQRTDQQQRGIGRGSVCRWESRRWCNNNNLISGVSTSSYRKAPWILSKQSKTQRAFQKIRSLNWRFGNSPKTARYTGSYRLTNSCGHAKTKTRLPENTKSDSLFLTFSPAIRPHPSLLATKASGRTLFIL